MGYLYSRTIRDSQRIGENHSIILYKYFTIVDYDTFQDGIILIRFMAWLKKKKKSGY